MSKEPTYFLSTFTSKQLLHFLKSNNSVFDPIKKELGPVYCSSHWRMILVQRRILEVLNKDLLNMFDLEENKIPQRIISQEEPLLSWCPRGKGTATSLVAFWVHANVFPFPHSATHTQQMNQAVSPTGSETSENSYYVRFVTLFSF